MNIAQALDTGDRALALASLQTDAKTRPLIEVSFDVQFTVRLLNRKSIGWPRVENAEYCFTVGNARPLDQAVQHATTEMLHWLEEDYGLDALGAGTLLGQVVEYDLGNVFDPAYTMVCKVSRRWLNAQ